MYLVSVDKIWKQSSDFCVITLFQVVYSGSCRRICWHFNFTEDVGSWSQEAIGTGGPVQVDTGIFRVYVWDQVLVRAFLLFNQTYVPIQVVHSCYISANWVWTSNRKTWEVSGSSIKCIAAQSLVADYIHITWYELIKRPCSGDCFSMLIPGIHHWSGLLQILGCDLLELYVFWRFLHDQ